MQTFTPGIRTRILLVTIFLIVGFGLIGIGTCVNADSESRHLRLVRSPEPEEDVGTRTVEPPSTPTPTTTQKPRATATAIPVTLPPGELYLPPNYNRLEIPRTRNLAGEPLPIPVPVTVHLNIRQILGINEAEEEVSLEMDMHVEWMDGSLLHASLTHIPGGPTAPTAPGGSNVSANVPPPRPPKFFLGDRFKKPTLKVLDPSFLAKIWKPDIFIENLLAVEQPDLMGKPATLKWSSRGNIGYTARLKVRIKCHFDFSFYPADTQACDVVLRSYSHNASALRLSWRRPTGLYLLSPADDNYDLAVGAMRRFRHVVYLDPRLKTADTREGFDALQFTIYARRLLSFHILQTYVPSMLYIAITWLCFMIPRRLIEGRIAISMTTLLTLTAMFGSVRESTPVVSYTKAIDRWMVACIAFVFLVLLEFSVLLWTESNREEEENERLEDPSQREPLVEDTHTKGPPSPPEVTVVGQKQATSCVGRLRKRVLKFATLVTFVENYSLVLILLILVTFNVSYWSWLLLRSGYHDWHVNGTHNAPSLAEGATAEEGDLEGVGVEELPVFA